MSEQEQKSQVVIDEAAARAAGLIKESKPEGRRRKGEGGRIFLGIVYPEDTERPKRPWRLGSWAKWAQAHFAKTPPPECSNPATGTPLEEAFEEHQLPISSALGALLLALGAEAKGLNEPDLARLLQEARRIGTEAIENHVASAKEVGLTRVIK